FSVRPQDEMTKLVAALGLDPKGVVFSAAAKRQNPAPLSEKIENWEELPSNIINTQINVPQVCTKIRSLEYTFCLAISARPYEKYFPFLNCFTPPKSHISLYKLGILGY